MHLKLERSEDISFLTNESEIHCLLTQTLNGLESMQHVSLKQEDMTGRALDSNCAPLAN